MALSSLKSVDPVSGTAIRGPEMKRAKREPSRRAFLSAMGALGVSVGMGHGRALAASGPLLKKAVPKTGERLPVIGMGSWRTFDVGYFRVLRDQRREVLQAFFDDGGSVIDSSPMYGSSQAVIGDALARIANTQAMFSATKVWTLFQSRGVRQMEASRQLWGVERFDLMQIHNLLDWEAHLETLVDWKAQGRVRYIGITTSHGRRHDDLEKVMGEEPVDFVQFTYNILDRKAERRLLPLAAERGLAVIINRPFRRGALFDDFARRPVPGWARAFDCANWAQFFLKFIVSHPAVTCAIPATTRVDHMRENMGAAYGRLPDAETRERMIRYVDGL
jgi:diketogulonate reductase-like aldo/keto reductase